MLSNVKAFVAFWYDFLVGDDIVVALGAVIAVAATTLLVDNGVNAWWLMPIAAALLLVESMWRGATSGRMTARRRPRQYPPSHDAQADAAARQENLDISTDGTTDPPELHQR